MDASEPTRRRWQSHEWNVLVVIALVAALGIGWVAWQVQIVGHRRAMRAQIEAGGGANWEWHEGFVVITRLPTSDYRISKIRRLIGDQEIYWIEFPRQLTDSDRAAIEAFPEAMVVSIPGSPAPPMR